MDFRAIVYGYLLSWVIKIVLLWYNIGLKIDVSFNMSIIRRFNLVHSAVNVILRYGLLILAPLFFGVEKFAYLYLTFYLGFFLYENVTLFLSSQLLPIFKGYLANQELFNLSLVRVLEYFSFVLMPFTIIPLLLFKDFFMFMLGENWKVYDLFFVLVIAGVSKAIFEVSNIVLMAKDKHKIMQRIRIFDVLLVLLLAAVLGYFFGLFGIALAVLISTLLSSFLFMFASFKILKLNVIGVSKDYFYIIFSAILTALSLGLLKEWFSAGGIFSVIILWIFGVVIFVFSIYLINRDFLKRFTRFVFGIIGEEE
jgi:hypothetical protein